MKGRMKFTFFTFDSNEPWNVLRQYSPSWAPKQETEFREKSHIGSNE